MWIELSEMFDKMIFSVFHPSFILCCAFDRFPRPLTLFILFRPFSDLFPTLFCLQRHASGVHRTNTHCRATLPPASLARKATQRTRAAATPGPRAHPVLLDARSRKGPAMIVKRVFGLPRQIHPWSREKLRRGVRCRVEITPYRAVEWCQF